MADFAFLVGHFFQFLLEIFNVPFNPSVLFIINKADLYDLSTGASSLVLISPI